MTPNVSDSGAVKTTRQDGSKLRAIREQELLLTRKQAAAKIGISQRTLEALELEARSASILVVHKIAKAYARKPQEFTRQAAAA